MLLCVSCKFDTNNNIIRNIQQRIPSPWVTLSVAIYTRLAMNTKLSPPNFVCIRSDAFFFADYSILRFSEFFRIILPSVPIILSICTNILTNFVFKQSQQNNGNEKSNFIFKQSQQNNANGESSTELQWPMNCSII